MILSAAREKPAGGTERKSLFMDRYQFDKQIRKEMEASCVPFAVYQFLHNRIIPVMLSAGFCELFGFDDHAEAYRVMENDTYRDTHPDDIARVAEAGIRFAREEADYDVVYRTHLPGKGFYRIIHSRGKHIWPEEGVRLAYIWYTDEGRYTDQGGSIEQSLGSLFSKLLHEQSAIRGASYNYLTGLPNMGYFFELAESGRKKILEAGGMPATLFIDVNGMGRYNRLYGFAEGDDLLREIAKLLARHFGADNCGHVGQDGFLVFTDAEGLEARLKTVFEECSRLHGGRSRTLRAGIYVEEREPLTDSGTACDRAKLASQKIRGTMLASYSYFNEQMIAELADAQYVAENLDRAMEDGWIRVYYQPVVRASTGWVCNEEALARWVDPERGMLMPDAFIPVLEKSRLIYKLDLFVLKQVLANMRQKKAAGLHVVPVSINLSRADFEACDMVEEIRRRVDEAGIGRSMIKIEITESMIGREPAYMKRQIERFHHLGFHVWMDDFGSGYSSLDVLQNFDFDLIKFDLQFMRRFAESEKTRTILVELMKMALSIGVDTLAEGVETQEQVDFLNRIGCDKAQGYLYSKPISLEEILDCYEHGRGIRQEDPAQAEYYTTVGTTNLGDPAVIRNGGLEVKSGADAVPMAVLEKDGDQLRLLRCNRAYAEYLRRLGDDAEIEYREREIYLKSPVLARMAEKAMKSESWIPVRERNEDGNISRAYARRIAVNPVTGAAAIVLVVLAMM